MRRRSMRPRSSAVLISTLALAATAGCAMQQEKVEKELAKPAAIDCRTAPGDVRLLQQEKANVVQRIAEGVTSIYPAGLVLGVVTGTETTKVKVAIGEYNKMIDARIAEIQRTCGL